MGSILRSLDETRLRSLKFRDFGGEPYVIKEIPDSSKREFGTGGFISRTFDEASLQVTKRLDDVKRITKLLVDAPGLKFIAKQQLINSTVNANKKGGFGRGLEQTAKTLAIILAQTAVSGTGIHLRSVTDEFTYLRRQRPNNVIPINLPGLPITQGDRVPSGVYRTTNLPPEDLTVYLNTGYKFYGNSFKPGIANSPKGLGPEVPDPYLPSQSSLVDNLPDQPVIFPPVDSSLIELGGTPGRNEYNYLPATPLRTSNGSRSKLAPRASYIPGEGSYTKGGVIDYGNSEVDIRLKMSKHRYANLRGTEDVVDVINYQEPIQGEGGEALLFEDIIPFRIKLYRPNFPTQILLFRAHLDSMSDNFGGTWNPINYIGRADTFFNFGTFQRSINVGFKIAAYTEAELLPLYRKLNWLVGSTAPTYKEGPDNTLNESPFMKGNFIKLTVGDYFFDIPGYFTSVNIGWTQDYPWEISPFPAPNHKVKEKYINTPIVPHILDVTLAFQPIHNFAAEAGEAFIGKPEIMDPVRTPALFRGTPAPPEPIPFDFDPPPIPPRSVDPILPPFA